MGLRMSSWGPTSIEQNSFQKAWLAASRYLMSSKWEARNLVVAVKDTTVLERGIHDKYTAFCRKCGLLTPKQVAYTIFPYKIARRRQGQELYDTYNRPHGMFERLMNIKRNVWGNYFRRFTHYEGHKGTVNQIAEIITKLNQRSRVYRSAYTMIVQQPGTETTMALGGPCLNYVAFQVEPGEQNTIGLLAVYRNHDFLKRAYGNYLGLIALQGFVCRETKTVPGPLTCISSHAYVEKKRNEFREFLESME